MPPKTNHYYTAVGTPTPAFGPYEQDVFHWDGALFLLLCFASWILFFWLWAWNHKEPSIPKKIVLPKEKWEAPSRWN